jgi:ABC-type transport system substrate-binding protein
MGNYTLVAKTMPELDKLLESLSTEVDPTKRKEVLEKIIPITFDSWTTLMIGTVPLMCGLGPKVDITFQEPAKGLPLFADVAKHKNQ